MRLTDWKVTMNRNEDRFDKQKENFYLSLFWVSESKAAGFGALHYPNPFQGPCLLVPLPEKILFCVCTILYEHENKNNGKEKKKEMKVRKNEKKERKEGMKERTKEKKTNKGRKRENREKE